MKMKLYKIVLFAACALPVGVHAQSLEDGKKMFMYERYNSARQIFADLTSHNANDPAAWYWLIRTDAELKDSAAARKHRQEVPAAIVSNSLIQVTDGFLALETGDSVTAQKDFQSAIGTQRKKDPEILEAVAESNIASVKGNLQYAINLLQEAAKKDKKNPALYCAIGDAYRMMYNGSEAFRAYQQAMDIDKNYADAYYKAGKIYQSQNNVDIFTEYYNKAIAADAHFAPVYYQLYYYYYYHDLTKAAENLNNFIANSDKDIQNNYRLMDMYYLQKKYPEAIAMGKQIEQQTPNDIKPRMYKLFAYSYFDTNQYADAETNMKKYLSLEQDSNLIAKDFDLMARVCDKTNRQDEAADWYSKAFAREKDSTHLLEYAKKLAATYTKEKNYHEQAYWLGKVYQLNKAATNVDLFYWGVAAYKAKEYANADSVFARYTTKYPDQVFGYYWRARSNAAIDTAMETGIAIPHYQKMIEVIGKDTANTNNRKWLIQAYGYLAAYKANKEKQYNEALDYYERVLALDPKNEEAEKYKEVLEKMIEAKQVN
ncbi:MAG: tetratricopeptide repeat protein [Bacteroidota bacterium]|nr:tetratricopeptide repeat protein [Bacteroidota bacterium]